MIPLTASCPACEASLMGLETMLDGRPSVRLVACPICDAPLPALNIQTDGRVCFCSQRGCKDHELERKDPARLFIAECPA